MKRKFKATPILASTTNGRYYLVDDKGNRYYDDDKIESILVDGADAFSFDEDVDYLAYESVEYLKEWAFDDAPKEMGLSGVEHLYVPKELEDDYFDFACEYIGSEKHSYYEDYLQDRRYDWQDSVWR